MDKEKNNSNDIYEILKFLHPNGSTFEVCGIGPRIRKSKLWGNESAYGNKPIVAGWFKDLSNAEKIISELDDLAEPEGVYISLNPCKPAVMARANNRLKPGVNRTKDNEIEHLQNLLIDVDPVRPSGVSASDQEKNESISIIHSIRDDLKKGGWTDPLVGESGNGGHLIYKIDLSNTAENVELLKNVLAALDQKYSTNSVKIDTAVFNPSRISKVYGTVARKGDSTAERPDRKAKILELPGEQIPVSIDLLKALALQAVKDSPENEGAHDNFSNDHAAELTSKDDHQSDKWDKARELFPRIDFPWHVLPAEIAESLQQLGRSHATSPVALPGAAIAIFSSLLGAAVCVSPKQSWSEPLIFWFCDIRPSGSGKTPAARALCSVLYDAQAKSDKKYKKDFKEWQDQKAKDRGPTPAKARTYFITDLTLEGLRAEISDHGGIVVVLDELSAFLSGQNQYKSKGSDRESWLCLWDGKPFRVVRAGESFTVSGARVSIFGGIQPKVWQVIFGRENGFFLEDGTVFRFLPTFEADQIYKLNAESWNDQNRKTWEQTLTLAMEWSDEITKGDNWKAKELLLNPEAQEYFLNWRNQLYEQMPFLPDTLKGFIPKIVSYSLRLSGVFYCMKQFVSNNFPETTLTLDDIEKGIGAAMFYMGHIVDATQALCTQSDFLPVEMTDQTVKLARTLENLRDELSSGLLAVGHIQKQYNAVPPPEEKIKSPRAMGSLLRQFGLTISSKRCRIGDRSGLSCLVWDGKTESFLKRHQQRQQSQHHMETADLAMLQKDTQRQHSQHDVDNVANEKSMSTRVKPYQSVTVANVDFGDIDSTETEKWETGAI